MFFNRSRSFVVKLLSETSYQVKTARLAVAVSNILTLDSRLPRLFKVKNCNAPSESEGYSLESECPAYIAEFSVKLEKATILTSIGAAFEERPYIQKLIRIVLDCRNSMP